MSLVGSIVADHALKISTAWMDGAFALVARQSKNVPMPMAGTVEIEAGHAA